MRRDAPVLTRPAGAQTYAATLGPAACAEQLVLRPGFEYAIQATPWPTLSGMCTISVPDLGLELNRLLPLDKDVVLATTEREGRLRLMGFSRSEGLAWPVGDLPVESTEDLAYEKVYVRPGSPVALVTVTRGQQLEVWRVPLDGRAPKPPDRYPNLAGVWPTPDGGYLLKPRVAEGEAPGPLLRVRDGAPEVVVEAVSDVEAVDQGWFALKTAAGPQLLDLNTGRIVPAPGMPAEAISVSMLRSGALLLSQRAADQPGGCSGALQDLSMLGPPYAGPPTPLVAGVSLQSWDPSGDARLVLRPRASMLYRLGLEVDGKRGGTEEDWRLCPDELFRASPRTAEAELFRVPTEGGAVEALGCATNVVGPVFEPGCADPAALLAYAAAPAPPPVQGCPSLSEAAERCVAAARRGDMAGLDACMGGDATPDLGSHSILVYGMLVELRMWALSQMAQEVEPTIEQDRGLSVLRYPDPSGMDMRLYFEQAECGWTMVGARRPR